MLQPLRALSHIQESVVIRGHQQGGDDLVAHTTGPPHLITIMLQPDGTEKRLSGRALAGDAWFLSQSRSVLQISRVPNDGDLPRDRGNPNTRVATCPGSCLRLFRHLYSVRLASRR